MPSSGPEPQGSEATRACGRWTGLASLGPGVGNVHLDNKRQLRPNTERDQIFLGSSGICLLGTFRQV